MCSKDAKPKAKKTEEYRDDRTEPNFKLQVESQRVGLRAPEIKTRSRFCSIRLMLSQYAVPLALVLNSCTSTKLVCSLSLGFVRAEFLVAGNQHSCRCVSSFLLVPFWHTDALKRPAHTCCDNTRAPITRLGEARRGAALGVDSVELSLSGLLRA